MKCRKPHGALVICAVAREQAAQCGGIFGVIAQGKGAKVKPRGAATNLAKIEKPRKAVALVKICSQQKSPCTSTA